MIPILIVCGEGSHVGSGVASRIAGKRMGANGPVALVFHAAQPKTTGLNRWMSHNDAKIGFQLAHVRVVLLSHW